MKRLLISLFIISLALSQTFDQEFQELKEREEKQNQLKEQIKDDKVFEKKLSVLNSDIHKDQTQVQQEQPTLVKVKSNQQDAEECSKTIWGDYMRDEWKQVDRGYTPCNNKWLEKLERKYTIEFDLRINSVNPTEETNLFKLSNTFGDAGNHGDRIFAVFMKIGTLNMVIYMDTLDEPYFVINTPEKVFETDTNYKVKFEVDIKQFRMYVDQREILIKEIPETKTFNQVLLKASQRPDSPTDASIKNANLFSGFKQDESCKKSIFGRSAEELWIQPTSGFTPCGVQVFPLVKFYKISFDFTPGPQQLGKYGLFSIISILGEDGKLGPQIQYEFSPQEKDQKLPIVRFALSTQLHKDSELEFSYDFKEGKTYSFTYIVDFDQVTLFLFDKQMKTVFVGEVFDFKKAKFYASSPLEDSASVVSYRGFKIDEGQQEYPSDKGTECDYTPFGALGLKQKSFAKDDKQNFLQVKETKFQHLVQGYRPCPRHVFSLTSEYQIKFKYRPGQPTNTINNIIRIQKFDNEYQCCGLGTRHPIINQVYQNQLEIRVATQKNKNAGFYSNFQFKTDKVYEIEFSVRVDEINLYINEKLEQHYKLDAEIYIMKKGVLYVSDQFSNPPQYSQFKEFQISGFEYIEGEVPESSQKQSLTSIDQVSHLVKNAQKRDKQLKKEAKTNNKTQKQQMVKKQAQAPVKQQQAKQNPLENKNQQVKQAKQNKNIPISLAQVEIPVVDKSKQDINIENFRTAKNWSNEVEYKKFNPKDFSISFVQKKLQQKKLEFEKLQMQKFAQEQAQIDKSMKEKRQGNIFQARKMENSQKSKVFEVKSNNQESMHNPFKKAKSQFQQESAILLQEVQNVEQQVQEDLKTIKNNQIQRKQQVVMAQQKKDKKQNQAQGDSPLNSRNNKSKLRKSRRSQSSLQ